MSLKALDQFVYFDADVYRREILHLSESQLHDLQATVKRKTVGAEVGMRAGVNAAVQSYGFSLFGTAVSARRLSVNEQRLAIIDARMKDKGWAEYKLRKRDYFAPVAAAGAVAAIVPGADALVGHLAGHATTHIATTAHAALAGTAHHGADAAGAVAAHPGMFAKAVEHGVEAQVNELTKGAVGHVAGVVPVHGIVENNANAVGYAAGEAMAKAGEVKVVSTVVSTVTEIGVQKAAAAAPASRKSKANPKVEVKELPVRQTSTPREKSNRKNNNGTSARNATAKTQAESSEAQKSQTRSKPRPDADLVIHKAISDDDAASIARLARKGHDVNKPVKGELPTILAVRLRHVGALSALLEAGARADGVDGEGRTALMWACANGDHVAASYLVKFGADVHYRVARGSRKGETALGIANKRNDKFICGLLKDAGTATGQSGERDRRRLSL